MRILILGGTRFVGRHIAQAALERGHELTLFNRGQSNPDLFAEAEQVRGDRQQGGLAALEGRTFDAVIDSTAYFPADVEAAAGVLAGRVGHYSLVSSLSVYRDPVAAGSDESAPLYTHDGPVPTEVSSAESYGALKRLCEQSATDAFARLLVARAGVIVGAYDYTDRFVYWPRRIGSGGRVLAAEPDQPVQLIDGRDFAAFVLDGAQAGLTGTFNVTGPARTLTMSDLFDTCRSFTGADATPEWVGDRFLEEQGLQPWEDLPLWLPAELAGFCAMDCSKAIAAGLRVRPIEDTIAEALHWNAQRPADEREQHLQPEREHELLAAYERWRGAR